MSISSSPFLGRGRTAQNKRNGSGSRRVTFGTEPRPPSSISTETPGPLLISSIFSPRAGLVQRPRASSAALPISHHLVSDNRRTPGSRGSTASSSGLRTPHLARSRSAGYSPKTSSAGFRPHNFGRQVIQTPLGSRSPSPLYTNQSLTRTPQQANAYSASASLQQRRPKTSSSSSGQFHSRRLGAEMYPALRKSDVEREKAFFRSGVYFIEKMLSETSRSQSARWRAMGTSRAEPNPYGDANAFCRASLAESHMNNAEEARVFHVVPQRVVSARGGGQRGINVKLQQANQSLCDRHHLLHRNLHTTSSNDNGHNSDANSSDNGNNSNENSNKTIAAIVTGAITTIMKDNNTGNKRSIARGSTDNVHNKSSPNNVNNITENSVMTDHLDISKKDLNTSKEENNKSLGEETDKGDNEAPNTGDRISQSPKTNPKYIAKPPDEAYRVSPSPKRGVKHLGSPDHTEGGFASSERSVRSSAKSKRNFKSAERAEAAKVDRSSPGLPQHRIRGVDADEHSAEWMEESKMKQEESVAILSEQLQSMMLEEDNDQLAHAQAQRYPYFLEKSGEGSRSMSGEGEESRSMSLLPISSENDEEEEREGERGGGGEEQKEGGSEERTICMKTMQCEVLGPYSCTDCTKIRLHQRQRQEQTSLYPDLVVDPRTLVAPDRLKRLTATLPPNLTSQRHTLDCGCAISMHPDFLFPVIVTDHDIQSRLKAERSSFPERGEERVHSGLVESDISSLSVGREVVVPGGVERRKEAAQILVIGEDVENEEEEVSMSPTDMKVTVRYHTPSPEQKGVFITT